MAADQRKKHLNAGHSSREQHKVKRKKVILSTIRSNITLEWDDKRKSVVPWREQIVIAWRDLSAFIDSVPNCYSALADIVSVPRETIELEDLIEVLSCEVGMTHPLAVTNCNIDMESLISDQNRSIATLAITTLLKTGNESSVDRLMKQITNFIVNLLRIVNSHIFLHRYYIFLELRDQKPLIQANT